MRVRGGIFVWVARGGSLAMYWDSWFLGGVALLHLEIRCKNSQIIAAFSGIIIMQKSHVGSGFVKVSKWAQPCDRSVRVIKKE